MNNYIVAGAAAAVIAGGAFMLFSGGSDSDSDEPTVAGADLTGPNDSVDVDGAATSDSAARGGTSLSQSANGTPRLHPIKAVCVDYEMTGQMMNGTSTRCHRNFAYEQYEIQNTSIGIGGFTQSQNQHTVTIGDTIYAIDLQTNTGTKTTNPMYEGIISAMENTSPEEMATTFITAMNFSPTGESKTIANTDCDMYSAPQMGTACLTGDGLMLEQSFMGNTQTAVNVSIGDGGDDANYTIYESVTITQGPDLSNGINGLMEQMGQQ